MFNRKILGFLEEWRTKSNRKPLVLRGARQVGKTSAVLIFAKKHFRNVVHLNLEKSEHLNLFRADLSLADFFTIIKAEFNLSVIPNETLIFIDEIQNSSALIKLLRFLYEDRPDIHVIAAGSLLEAKIEKEGFSFPVGRVEFCYMYPLNFFEYLEAKGEGQLLEILQVADLKAALPDPVHQIALRNFYDYAMIGGMPEIVSDYINQRDINRLKPLYAALLTGYLEDVFKYASLAEAKYLSYVIETAPLFAGRQFTYDKFGGSNFRSREMNRAFSLLEKTMLLFQVRATSSRDLPLMPKEKRPKKLIYLDSGLVNYKLNILNEYAALGNFDSFYQGRLAEQIVAQNLLSLFIKTPAVIYYWARERNEGSAEVDFCLPLEGRALGIEVKSGKTGKLKSLMVFAEQNSKSRLLRVYSGKFKGEKAGSADLISLPFYLLPRTLEIVAGR